MSVPAQRIPEREACAICGRSEADLSERGLPTHAKLGLAFKSHAAVEVLRSWAIAREEFTADQAKAYLTDYGFADGPASGAIGALSGSGHLPCDPGRGTFHYREVAP